MHGRECEAPHGDVRSVSDVVDRCRIYYARREYVSHALVSDGAGHPEALELVGIADHRAPVVSSLGDRRGVDEPMPARAVIAHQLCTSRVVGRRIGDLVPLRYIDLP